MSGERPLDEALVKAIGDAGRAQSKAALRRLTGAGESECNEALSDLERQGRVVRLPGGGQKYALPEQMGLVTGRLQANPRGYAFLLQPTEDDYFIPPGALGTAWHGDMVLARPTDPKKREASVERVLDRANQEILGVLRKARRGFVAQPLDDRVTAEIQIQGATRGAKDGEAVALRVVGFGSAEGPALAQVTKRLGRIGDPGVDQAIVMERHKLPAEFPAGVLKAAEKLPGAITEADLRGRDDFRTVTTVTIDGKDAKDLDDAVSLQPGPEEGTVRLMVHIADVTHYVREDQPLDREAFQRATSVYLPGTVLPMLPQRLSNGLASLNPKVDRLTMTAIMDFDRAGKRLAFRVTPSIIRSDARLTYDAVNEVFDGRGEGDAQKFSDLLLSMRELKDVLRTHRLARGAIDFDLYEDKVELDEAGEPVRIVRRYRTEADSLIEEFMLAANEAVAEHFSRRHIPFVFRVHESPDDEKLQLLRQLCGRLGLPAPRSATPQALGRVLAAAEGTREEQLVSMVVLRSMTRAQYSDRNKGHFGLAAKYYTHFTSPIRRYPDLQIHRIIKDALKPKRPKGWRERLEARLPHVAQHSSDMERNADEAERELTEMKKMSFMKDKVGMDFSGVVTGVTRFGVFVTLEVGVEGLIRLADLGPDEYRFDTELLSVTGVRTKETLRLGDVLTAKVRSVDVLSRRLDLGRVLEAPAPEAPGNKASEAPVEQPTEGRYNQNRRRRRRRGRRQGGKHERHSRQQKSPL